VTARFRARIARTPDGWTWTRVMDGTPYSADWQTPSPTWQAALDQAVAWLMADPSICHCHEDGMTDDDMYLCGSDDCIAHDYLATGGALSFYQGAEYPTNYPPASHPAELRAGAADLRAIATR